MSNGQEKYDKDDERRLRQELLEGEAQRQQSYSKDDEKKLQEEVERKPENDKSGDTGKK